MYEIANLTKCKLATAQHHIVSHLDKILGKVHRCFSKAVSFQTSIDGIYARCQVFLFLKSQRDWWWLLFINHHKSTAAPQSPLATLRSSTASAAVCRIWEMAPLCEELWYHSYHQSAECQ